MPTPSPAPDVTGVLLAAGHARRYGSDKRRLPWPGGPTLMEAALRPLRAACVRVVVVLPPGDAWGLRICRAHGVEIAWSFNRRAGLAASLGAALPLARDSAALVVALADMGDVQPASIQALITHWRQQPGQPVLPTHHGQPGNPRLIPSALYPALHGLHGDDGVRQAIAWPRARRLEVADAGVLVDLDVPASS
ncbi:MAG: NTP transferase domain-containing protein [Comamonas sp.]